MGCPAATSPMKKLLVCKPQWKRGTIVEAVLQCVNGVIELVALQMEHRIRSATRCRIDFTAKPSGGHLGIRVLDFHAVDPWPQMAQATFICRELVIGYGRNHHATIVGDTG